MPVPEWPCPRHGGRPQSPPSGGHQPGTAQPVVWSSSWELPGDIWNPAAPWPVLQDADTSLAVDDHRDSLADPHVVEGGVAGIQPQGLVAAGGDLNLVVLNVGVELTSVADPAPVDGLAGQHGSGVGQDEVEFEGLVLQAGRRAHVEEAELSLHFAAGQALTGNHGLDCEVAAGAEAGASVGSGAVVVVPDSPQAAARMGIKNNSVSSE